MDVRIVTVVGARPQFIKCVMLSQSLRRDNEEIIVHTGQHYDYGMSDIFFQELGIHKPDYNLGVGSGTQGEQTGRMIIELEKVLKLLSPDCTIVFGDTNSTLAASIASVKLGIKVAHVEAGLRSYDRKMPEEINRIMTDHISDYLFVPTDNAKNNLTKEGVTEGVFHVGDIMVETLSNYYIKSETSEILKTLSLTQNDYHVATVHRASNTDDPNALKQILNMFRMSPIEIVFPIHPRTKKCIEENGLGGYIPRNVRLIDPLGYLDMIQLMKNAKKIITDSGGIQKEAYILDVPCLTLRDTTEWMETLNNGWNELIYHDEARFVEALSRDKPTKKDNVFGTGETSKRIVKVIETHCGGQ